MSSAIHRVNAHAAREAESEQQNAEKTPHARADHFASTHYKGRLIRKTRMKTPSKGRLPATLTKRPTRQSAARGVAAGVAPKYAPAGQGHSSTHSWRDPYRQGSGNGRSGNQQNHGDDDRDADDGFDNKNSRAGKFSASREPRQGAVIPLSDDVQVYAASVSSLVNRRSLICQRGIDRLNQLPGAHAFTRAQAESHHLLTPLMAHQVFSLRRTRSQLVNALARKEGQVRGSPTLSSRVVHDALLDLLAARSYDDETAESDESIGLKDIGACLRKTRASK